MTSGLGHARRRAHQGRGKRAAIQGEERGKSKKKRGGRRKGRGGKGRGKREEPVGGGGRKSLRTRAFVGAAPIVFALQVLHSGRFALFCRKQGAFMWVYVAVSRSDFYVFLREPPYPF